MNLGKPIEELSTTQLDQTLKHKYNYVIDVSTIYKLEQVDNNFKKLLDDSLEVSKSDQCIIEKTKGDSTGWEQLMVGIFMKNFNFHFENVVEDTNSLMSWQVVVDRKISSEEAKLLTKPICRVKHFKNLPNGFIASVSEPKEHFYDDSKLELYLQKRFLSPRLEKFGNLPQPYVIHTMDFIKMLSFLDFVSTYGLHFDSLDNFYKKLCIRYPEEITGSKADFENFKNLVKEFIHLLAYRNTISFTESVMLCGFDVGSAQIGQTNLQESFFTYTRVEAGLEVLQSSGRVLDSGSGQNSSEAGVEESVRRSIRLRLPRGVLEQLRFVQFVFCLVKARFRRVGDHPKRRSCLGNASQIKRPCCG